MKRPPVPRSRWLLLLLPVLLMASGLVLLRAGGPGVGTADESLLLPGLADAATAGAPLAPAPGTPAIAPTRPMEPERMIEPEGAEPDSAEAEEPLDPADFSPWTTFAKAQAIARSAGKPILLVFEAEGDGPSFEMRRAVFDDAAAGLTVQATVVPVAVAHRVTGDPDPEAERLERRFSVEAFPTLVLVHPTTGQTLRRTGYPGPSETLRWITDGAARMSVAD